MLKIFRFMVNRTVAGLIALSSLFFISQSAVAMEIDDGLIHFRQANTCPTAHSEYKLAYAQILSLKSRLQELGCKDKPVSEQIQNLLTLVAKDRSKFLSIVNGNVDKKLSAEDADYVQTYSEGVALQVANFVSLINELPEQGLFGSAKACSLSEEDRFAFLGTASSVVYEATRLISKVSGPQNVPILIGGHILSGILKGMSLYMDSKDRFDFKDSKKRLFFAETLCMYQQYDFEVRKLISPEAHLGFLQKAEDDLVDRVQTLVQDCPECLKAVEDFDSKEDPYSDSIASADTNFQSQEATQDSFQAQSFAGETSEFSILVKKSIRDLILGDDSSEEARINSNLQDTKIFLKSLHWLQGEKEKFQSILEFPTRGLEPGEIQSLRVVIRKFMELAGGDFLIWFHSNEIPKKGKDLRTNLINAKIPMDIKDFHEIGGFEVSTSPMPWEFQRMKLLGAHQNLIEKNTRYYNSLLWLYERFKSFENRVQSRDEYCQYFTEALIYPTKIEKLCEAEASSTIAFWKGYVARTALLLSPLLKTNRALNQLGPIQLNESEYASYLELNSTDVSDIEADVFMKTPEDYMASFSGFNRNREFLFESGEEQLDFEIKAWRTKNQMPIFDEDSSSYPNW